MTKAVILANGRNDRIGEICEHTPTALLRIGSRTLVEHSLLWLVQNDVREIALLLESGDGVSGQRAECVARHVGDGTRLGATVSTLRIPETLGDAGALKAVQTGLPEFFGEDPFVLVRGDGLYDFDLVALVASHGRSPAIATLAIQRVADDETLSPGVTRIEADRSGRILRFLEGEQDPAMREVDTGVVVLETSLLRHLAAEGPKDLIRDLYTLVLRNNGILGAQRVKGRALIVDSPEALAMARGWFDGEVVGETIKSH